MNNKEKTREELIKDLESLGKRVAELEKFEAECALLKGILQEEKDRAEKYLDIAGVMMVIIDLDGKVAFINKEGCKILGYDKKDIIGKNWFDNFLPRDIKEKVEKVFKELISGKIEPVEFIEENVICAMGEEKTISWHNTVLKDKLGKITATLSSGEDVTEHRAIEKAQSLLAKIVESSEDAITGKDLNGIITSWNKGAEKIYGYSKDEIVGKPISVLTPSDCHDEIVKILKKIKTGGSIANFETSRIRKDGRVVLVSLTISPVKDSKGNIIGASTIARDITKEKELVKRIEESEIKFRAIFESSSDAIMLLDEEKFIDCNKATLKMFGCKLKEELINKRPADLSTFRQPDGEESDASSKRHIKIAFEKGSDFFDWEHKRSDGSVFQASVLLSCVSIGGKKILQANVRDISERKIAEEKIKKANEEWARTFDSVSDGIFIIDKDNVFVRANKAFLELLKVTSDQIVGKKCHEVVHKLTKSWPNCPFDKTKIDKKTHIEEVNDPGLGISLLVTTSPIFDDRGEFIGAVHTSKDITERKRAEKELIKLSSFPELNPNPIVEIDSKGHIEYINPAAKNIFPDLEKLGLKHPFLEGLFDSISVVSKEGKNTFQCETQAGNRYFVEDIHITKDTGSIRIYGLDITERKNMENEIKKKMATMEKFQKITVGRELRMKELKARIAELEAQLKPAE